MCVFSWPGSARATGWLIQTVVIGSRNRSLRSYTCSGIHVDELQCNWFLAHISWLIDFQLANLASLPTSTRASQCDYSRCAYAIIIVYVRQFSNQYYSDAGERISASKYSTLNVNFRKRQLKHWKFKNESMNSWKKKKFEHTLRKMKAKLIQFLTLMIEARTIMQCTRVSSKHKHQCNNYTLYTRHFSHFWRVIIIIIPF